MKCGGVHESSLARILFTISFVVLTSSCNTLVRRGQEQLKNGEFSAAIESFEGALADDPNNVEAQAGRSRAREEYLSKKLIDIRMLRMGSNAIGATKQLMDVIRLEKEWGFLPRKHVASTQEEETENATKYISRSINSMLERKWPLVAKKVADEFRPILEGHSPRTLPNIRQRITAAGMERCKYFTQLSNGTTPFFRRIVNQFCIAFDKNDRQLASLPNEGNLKSEIARLEFSGLDLDLDIEDLPSVVYGTLAQKMNDQFRNSPWFDENSTSRIKMRMGGKFIRQVQSNTIEKIHQYTIKEPYISYEPTLKSRQVPYSTTRQVCTYSSTGGSVCANIPTTEYTTQFYTENEPVTRYRESLTRLPLGFDSRVPQNHGPSITRNFLNPPNFPFA